MSIFDQILHKMKLKAVIVDDNSRDIDTLKVVIENYCSDIEVVGTACLIDIAFKIIREKEPDVVFLDVHMPRGGGFDLLERFPLRKFDVVIVSGSGGKREKAIDFSTFEYIEKPIDIRKFQEICKRIVRHRTNNPVVVYKRFPRL